MVLIRRCKGEGEGLRSRQSDSASWAGLHRNDRLDGAHWRFDHSGERHLGAALVLFSSPKDASPDFARHRGTGQERRFQQGFRHARGRRLRANQVGDGNNSRSREVTTRTTNRLQSNRFDGKRLVLMSFWMVAHFSQAIQSAIQLVQNGAMRTNSVPDRSAIGPQVATRKMETTKQSSRRLRPDQAEGSSDPSDNAPRRLETPNSSAAADEIGSTQSKVSEAALFPSRLCRAGAAGRAESSPLVTAMSDHAQPGRRPAAIRTEDCRRFGCRRLRMPIRQCGTAAIFRPRAEHPPSVPRHPSPDPSQACAVAQHPRLHGTDQVRFGTLGADPQSAIASVGRQAIASIAMLDRAAEDFAGSKAP